MPSPNDIAQTFTISGLLDESSSTRSRFPVVELAMRDVADHPGNLAYSMDEAAIGRLAESIRRDGLTDIPLVRKLPDGSFQMISGHRRKAAYEMLSKEDPSFEKMPCRVIEGITDDQATILLHAANYFVRELSVTERAAATRALGVEVERMRESDPSLAGVRTDDIKAAIIGEQTGRRLSGKSIQRQEALAETIEGKLTSGWRKLADSGALSGEAIRLLAETPEKDQMKLHVKWVEDGGYGKRDTTDFIRRHTRKATEADVRLRRADRAVQKYLAHHGSPIPPQDRGVIEALARHVGRLEDLA